MGSEIMGVSGGISQEPIRGEGFDQLRAIQAMGPDVDIAHCRATEGQNLKRENNTLKEKLFATATPKNHHFIAAVAIGAVIHLGLHRRNCQGGFGAVQLKIQAEFSTYSQSPRGAVCVDDNTSDQLMIYLVFVQEFLRSRRSSGLEAPQGHDRVQLCCPSGGDNPKKQANQSRESHC